MAASKRWVVALFFACLAAPTWAQDRYIVLFADKAGTPHSIGQPLTYLSQRAVDRRLKSGSALTNDDLPVTPSYVTQVKATGAKAFFTSRWLNGLLIEADNSQAAAVASLPFVANMELVAPGHRLLGGRIGKFKDVEGTVDAAATDAQIQLLGLDEMHGDGLDGLGVMIAVFDAGFPMVNSMTSFQNIVSNNQIKLSFDFITNSGDAFQFHSHGTNVFSTMAATRSGFAGGATSADYLLFVTEDVFSEYRIEEYNWLFAAERADSAGADIIQSSLGYSVFDDHTMNYSVSELNGATAIISKAASMARDRGIIVVTSAGNEGSSTWHYITPPADADGIIAVGSVYPTGIKSSFSSVGPSADGRIKPDVVAMGQGAAVVDTNDEIRFVNGTSFASPLVASLVAGLLQRYPTLSPSEMVSAIKASASISGSPDNQLGYGIPHYRAVVNYLNSELQSEPIIAHPMPMDDKLYLSFQEPPGVPIELDFYDTQGRVAGAWDIILTWQNNPLEFNVSELAAGYYCLRIRSNGLTTTIRVVKR